MLKITVATLVDKNRNRGGIILFNLVNLSMLYGHFFSYTMDKDVRWQRCDIPLCPNSTEKIATLDLNNSNLEMESVFTPTTIFILGSIGLVAILIINVCVLLIYRISHYNKRSYPTAGFTAVVTQNNVDINKLPANVNYHQTSAKLNPKLEKLEYPRNDIIYIKVLIPIFFSFLKILINFY